MSRSTVSALGERTAVRTLDLSELIIEVDQALGLTPITYVVEPKMFLDFVFGAAKTFTNEIRSSQTRVIDLIIEHIDDYHPNITPQQTTELYFELSKYTTDLEEIFMRVVMKLESLFEEYYIPKYDIVDWVWRGNIVILKLNKRSLKGKWER